MLATAFDNRAHTSTSQTLRPYQQDALRSILSAWNEGKSPLVVLATGLGKTTVIAELLVQHFDPSTQRALVIAHTQELIYQPAERIRNQFGERMQDVYLVSNEQGSWMAQGLGIVMAEQDEASARIIVATRQSLREKRFKRVTEHGAFDIVIIDEAHHAAPGSQYLDIIELAKQQNPNVRIVGFTATPKRTDGKALKAAFDEISFNYGIVPAIRDGYLSPATRIKVKTNVNLQTLKTTAGDYKQDDLIGVLDAANWVELAVDAYKQHILDKDRAALAFFPGVAESQAFVQALQAQGIAAAHIDANTPKDIRQQILRDYKRGDLRVVSNMGVLTEGFDAAHTSAILLARPTRSETLFTQIIGRGLRVYPGKKDCLIVDLTVTDTQALTVGTLIGKMYTCPGCSTEYYRGLKHCPTCGLESPVQTRTKECPACEAEIPISVKLCPECGYQFLTLPREIDFGGDHGQGLIEEIGTLFGSMSAAWYQDSEGWLSVGVGDDGAMVIAPPDYADSGWFRQRIQNGYNLLPQIDPELVDTLKHQIGQLERMIRRAEQYTLYYAPSRKRDDFGNWLPARPVEYLRANADLPSLIAEADNEVLNRAGTSKALSRKDSDWRYAPASQGQVNFMRSLGVKDIPADLDKGTAAKVITHTLGVREVVRWIAGDTLAAPASE